MASKRIPTRRWQIACVVIASMCGAGCTLPTWQLGQTKDPSPLTAPLPQLGASGPALRQWDDREKANVCRTAAEALAAEGDERLAIEQFERARRFGGDADGTIGRRLAVLYDRQGRFDAADREYRAALTRFPKDADLLCDYGYYLHSRGRQVEAETHLKSALVQTPGHAKATLNLAVVVAEQGRMDEAVALFEKVVGAAAAEHNVGLVLARQGRTEDARQRFARAVALDDQLQAPVLALACLNEPLLSSESAPSERLSEGETVRTTERPNSSPAAPPRTLFH